MSYQARFSFVGTPVIPKQKSDTKRPFCKEGEYVDKQTKKKRKTLSMTFGVKETDSNMAFVEAFDSVQSTIKTMDADNEKMDVDWDDRFDEEIVDKVSNAKQIKEVFSEMVYARPLWDDEYPGEKFDVKAYQLEKDSSGKYTNVRKTIPLDRDKKYIVAFLDKTRNDDDKIQVLYQFNGRFNRWKEIGYCSVFNEHK